MINDRKKLSGSDSDLFIRPLNLGDYALLEDFWQESPERILPRIHIEQHGFDSSFVRPYAVFSEERLSIQGILLRFKNTIMVIDHGGNCSRTFAQLIDTQNGIAGIRGNLSLLRSIEAILQYYTSSEWEKSFFMQLNSPPACPPERIAMARTAFMTDLDKLVILYTDAGVMYRSRQNLKERLENGRVFVVEEEKTYRRPARIVSCAVTNAEGKEAALVGGVYSLPETRNRGYASACVSALCRDLQKYHKTPCLFYENPIAGHAYRKLGFAEKAKWGILYTKRKK